jgi:hypothetical protein
MAIPVVKLETPLKKPDDPLPLTFRFVMVLGVAILVGWFLMFALLASRW